jgi:hypothetical protein
MATFQFTEDEFVRGSLALTWKRRTTVMFGIAFVLMIAAMAFRGHTMLASILYPLGGMALLVTFVYFLTRQRLKRVFREQQSLRESINVVIDENQLNYSWSRGTYVLPWTNVRRGFETREFFILFESSMFGRMIPKRVLSQEEEAVIRGKIKPLPRR